MAQPPSSPQFVKAVRWGNVGWRPNSAIRDNQQIGAYGDVVLTRRWNQNAGLQLISRGFNPSGWMVVSGSELPYWQQTVTPGNVSGGQRFGAQAHSGSLTPWTAAQMQGALVRAQIQQSGLANAAFTQALIQANLQAA